MLGSLIDIVLAPVKVAVNIIEPIVQPIAEGCNDIVKATDMRPNRRGNRR